jgi:hypothetical protein
MITTVMSERMMMTDAATKKPIRVSTDGTTGPYIVVPVDQLGKIRNLLEADRIRFWVDHHAISIDGKPAVTVINLARGTDPTRVQASLDTVA